jgi:hypothetical protein
VARKDHPSRAPLRPARRCSAGPVWQCGLPTLLTHLPLSPTRPLSPSCPPPFGRPPASQERGLLSMGRAVAAAVHDRVRPALSLARLGQRRSCPSIPSPRILRLLPVRLRPALARWASVHVGWPGASAGMAYCHRAPPPLALAMVRDGVSWHSVGRVGRGMSAPRRPLGKACCKPQPSAAGARRAGPAACLHPPGGPPRRAGAVAAGRGGYGLREAAPPGVDMRSL